MPVSSTSPVSTVFSPGRPVSLSATLGPLRRSGFDPTFRTGDSGVWRTLLAPTGPATLHLERTQHGIVASAWGDGAEWAIEGVPALLGEGDDWNGLDVSTSPALAESLRLNPGLRLTRTCLVFETLLQAILEQKVTGKQAGHSWRWLLARHGQEAPGPAPAGMAVFPASDVVLRIPSWEWHRAGVGPQRADAIMRAAAVAASLERTLDLGRGGPAVERALRSIPGVGVWTAAETMQRAHGDPDAPSVGDYHLASVVGLALTGKVVDDDGMLELLEPWAGHRHRVVRLIEASGFTKPRRGPRMTVQDHRDH